MSKFTKGQRVFRYYIVEPAFLYGSGRVRENGEVLGEAIEFHGVMWVPVKWQYSVCPSLDMEANVFPMEEASSERV